MGNGTEGTEEGRPPPRDRAPYPDELRKRFFYQKPRDQQAVRDHEKVSQLTYELACQLCFICPPGRNLSIALTDLESVRMRANAAIAVDDPRPKKPMSSQKPVDEFRDLFCNFKLAVVDGNQAKIDSYRADITAYTDHVDKMAELIPTSICE